MKRVLMPLIADPGVLGAKLGRTKTVSIIYSNFVALRCVWRELHRDLV
jgi:hypothetical protein